MSSALLKPYYMDLHIHIGRTKTGRPVKITASNQLTLTSILEESLFRKGLDVIGVIDAQSPEVLGEVIELIDTGYASEIPEGGVRYREKITLLLGSELEIYDENSYGPVHVLCFLPTIEQMKVFSDWCKERMKNIHLSSQRIYVNGKELQKKIRSLDGLFIPAHIFTPFKSLYGKGVKVSLEEILDPQLIDGVELGLSSDTLMAKELMELNQFTFLTNSDAHSTGKIAREHQIVHMEVPTFREIAKALKAKGGRSISKNIGLDPRLGKYYLSICKVCGIPCENGKCPIGHKGIIRGVSERIVELVRLQKEEWMKKGLEIVERDRPAYIHQVPLEFIPGCGPKTRQKLLDNFQTEMKVIHEIPFNTLKQVIPEKIAEYIIRGRNGRLTIHEGGAGHYGKIK
ncbi:endonuclease Q family protein [Evansella tamaricis]|uniref:endonuclease Q family protein n=1 Tax=Evansella tamaricis TaxID=2069301 RepID=UPI0031B8B134